MKVDVIFTLGGVMRLGKADTAQKKRFYPFTWVDFYPHEELICPFCKKPLSNLYCDCEEFKQKFALLQEKNGDHEHSSSLQYGAFGERVTYRKKISELTVKSLSATKIQKLDPDFWDYAVACAQFGHTYWVKKGTYQDGKIKFYCKDLNTKKVYLCTIAMEFEYEDLSLRSSEEVFIPGHSERLGDYHYERKYHKFSSFAGWAGFCQALREV